MTKHSKRPLPSRLLPWFLLFLLSAALFGAEQEETTVLTSSTLAAASKIKKGEKIVFKIELHEAMMGKGVPFFIHRAVEAAKAAKADAIILDLNTPGGSLDVLMQINDEMLQLDIKTYAYINRMAASAGSLLAIVTDEIVMSPVSSIGAAQVITGTGRALEETVEQKVNATLKGMIRGAAKRKGHPVILCEAFIDRDIEIPGLTPKGEVLMLDQEQATTETVYIDAKTSETVVIPPLALYIAEDIEDLLEKEGLWPAKILNYELTWSENLAKWLMAMTPLLLLIGLGAFYMEAKAPGIGVPGVVGVIALALFFWGGYVADLASVIEIVLFFVGLFLIAVEIFVLPGFGLAGVSGVLLILVSLIMAMIKLPPPDIPNPQINYGMLSRALWNMIWTFAALLPTIWILGKVLPSIPMFGRLGLDPALAATDDLKTPRGRGMRLEPPPEPEDLIGKTGETLTDLRPAGTALVDGKHLDVTTLGDYIEKGELVHVIEVHGNVLTVERVRQSARDS